MTNDIGVPSAAMAVAMRSRSCTAGGVSITLATR